MIHVQAKPEPKKFHDLVRAPGLAFLATCPKPAGSDWKHRDYWREVLKDLRRLYGCVCAYSCHWISSDTGAKSIDHFVPKNMDPSQAYEWKNFRLACALVNARKGTRQDVLDPFAITDGWFRIDFPSLLVKPAPRLGAALTKQVRTTIEALGLNDEETCLENRATFVRDYCTGHSSFAFLRKEAPFLAKELQRQRLVTRIKEIMVYDD